MKKCSYCGAEYPDDAEVCATDHTLFENPSAPTLPSESEPKEHIFAPLSAEDRKKDLVTVVTCGTLADADVVVARLQAAGIETFLPDEYAMQAIGSNFGTFGSIRVQIAPSNYDAAKDLLGGMEDAR